jgi:tetratricopeptide (TPR) repeat protein
MRRIAESDDIEVLRRLVMICGRMGLTDLALELSDRVADQTGSTADLMLKARSLVAMNDGSAAEAIVDELLADPAVLDDKEAHYQSLLIDGTVQGLRGESAVESAIRLQKDIAVLNNNGDTSGAGEVSAKVKELIAETTKRFDRGITAVNSAQDLFPGRLMPRLRRHELLRAKVLLLRDAAIEADILANGRAARELAPIDWRANKCLMEAHVVMGNPREAMTVIDQYFKNGGMSSEARTTLVGIARLEGKTGLAIPPLQRAMERDPSDPEWPRAIAKMLVESGNLDAASDMWWKVIELETSDAAIESFIELEFRSDDFNADRVAEVFKLRPNIIDQMPNLKAAYAALLYKSGDSRRAEREFARAYTDAIESDRTDADPLVIDKVRSYYSEIYPFDTLDQAEARISGMSDKEMGAHEYNALSIMADGDSFEDLDMESAIRYLRLARERSAGEERYHKAVLDRLARHLYMDNDCAGAVEVLKEIVSSGAPAASTLNNLAYMMYDCLGDSAGAIFYSTQALQAAPASPEYLDTQGVILADLGRLDEAELYLSRAVSIRPTPSNLLHYASLMHETGRDAEAEILLEKIGKEFPGLTPKLQAQVNELISKIK